MTETVSIAGPYCESGDVLIEDLPLPRIEEGELLAVPMSGAYQLSMASNYNGAARPPAVWLETGKSRQIVRRETSEELNHRQLSILTIIGPRLLVTRGNIPPRDFRIHFGATSPVRVADRVPADRPALVTGWRVT
jgi:hypothetical protein